MSISIFKSISLHFSNSLYSQYMCVYHTYTHILFTYIYLWRRRERRNTKNILLKEFPGGLVVNILGFHSCGLGSTPGQGTEILQAICPGKKKKKKEYPFFTSILIDKYSMLPTFQLFLLWKHFFFLLHITPCLS